jgi:molybdopterin-guanine dinucleotide biosynthesis protein A
MGTDKAMLDFDGRPLVSRVVERVTSISDDVYVVSKRAMEIDARVVLEPPEPQTPLLGVLTALRAAAHPLVFICGCDMPFVSPALATFLADRADDLDAVVPFRDGKSEALHCVWSASAADKVAALLDQGEFGLRRALAEMDVDVVGEATWRAIDSDGRAFTNLNTPDDVAAIRSAPSEPRPSSEPR